MVFLYVRLEVSLVCVVDQQTAVVEGKVSFAECVPGLVLLAHVSGHQRLERGSLEEGLNSSLLSRVASHDSGLGGHDC